MKKFTPTRITAALVLSCSLSVVAQPTLTGAGSNPVIGDQLTYHKSDYVSPGNAGANQTWNLSAMTTSVSSSQFVPMMSTPSPTIPNANVGHQVGSSSYYYYNANSTVFQNCGYTENSVTMSFSNPEDILRYPFTFNSTFTDTYMGTNSFLTRTGTSTVTADGYGTLITPAGTYSNVLRVHIYRDLTDGPGTPFATNRKTHEYRWYSQDKRYHLATVSSQTISGGGGTSTQQEAMYVSNYLVDVKKQSEWSNSVSLFPVPASDKVRLKFNGFVPAAMKVSLFNLVGQLVMESNISTYGKNEFEVNVSEVPDGIYFVNLDGGNDYTAQTRVVISK